MLRFIGSWDMSDPFLRQGGGAGAWFRAGDLTLKLSACSPAAVFGRVTLPMDVVDARCCGRWPGWSYLGTTIGLAAMAEAFPFPLFLFGSVSTLNCAGAPSALPALET